MRKLFGTLLQVRLAVVVIAALGIAFLVVGVLIGMPPFAYIVIGLLIAAPTLFYIYKPRESALTNAKALTVFFGATDHSIHSIRERSFKSSCKWRTRMVVTSHPRTDG